MELSNTKEIEDEAKESANKHVATIIKKHGKLEKVDQIRRKILRQKGSVEAQLKSAIQQQLDGVHVGLDKLKEAQQEVAVIDGDLCKMAEIFDKVPSLYQKLSVVRDENMKHSQYTTARENLKHIFTVPESVEKTKQWINEGKLLHTHQCLRDLENSRDDLLYELHKLPNQSPHDKSMLKAYFSDVEELSILLEKQLRLVLSRTLNTVRKEPTVIVTALRIIEREEKADDEVLKQARQTGFLPPGRPKKWKKMAFEVLEKSVATRIEGTQIEERSDNKNWLITYLELIRQLILEDLRVVKTLCVPCFPPRYNIIQEYVKMYHHCLSTHLHEVIQNGLEGNEYVTILSWVHKTYFSDELLGHYDLTQFTSTLEKNDPLLSVQVINQLQNEYLNNMEKNYAEWMKNTLISEKQEWYSSTEPQVSHTSGTGPIIIFQMIDQNLQVTKTVSEQLTFEALKRGIDHIIRYGNSYREGILEFKSTYFSDRKQVPFFTHHMITIVNNCLQLADLSNQLEKQYLSELTETKEEDVNTAREKFKRLRTVFLELRNQSGIYLLEELFLDLEKYFSDLFTSNWLGSSVAVDTICLTTEDYFQDYNGLAQKNFDYVVYQVRRKYVEKYLTSLLSKKVSFKIYHDCTNAANQVLKEVNQLKHLLNSLCKDINGDDPFEAIIALVEVLKSDDDMLSFELHRVVEKYPDISDEHLLRLLHLRGDLVWSNVKDKVAHLIRPKTCLPPSVFKCLVFPKLVNLFNN
ncbi:hypothetical protein WA026_002104 [Henosepilachna vigintioctopunctata]|uniref:Exocyst complex component 3 n=1 Tax=Henosepilachna vigintioctopunctata TaxID=420089 RepID=A0AAW1U2Y6_9CUCU